MTTTARPPTSHPGDEAAARPTSAALTLLERAFDDTARAAEELLAEFATTETKDR